jgi:hypothetical protein
MAIAVNKNTQGTPLTVAGRSGAQSIKLIQAPRLYVKAADALTTTPVQNYYTKSSGATPTGWTDLGIVDGYAKIQYDKKVNEVRTGPDEYFRAAYTKQKTGVIEASLLQLDDITLEQISGLTASVITSGSVINYQIGSEDLNQLALLLVVTNKLDSKEWQFYNPSAYLNFTFEEKTDGISLKVTGLLPFFTPAGATKESMMSTTIFA